MIRTITRFLSVLLPTLALLGAAHAEEEAPPAGLPAVQLAARQDTSPVQAPPSTTSVTSPSVALVLADANPPTSVTALLESEDVVCEEGPGIALPVEVHSMSHISASEVAATTVTTTREKTSPEGHALVETTTRLITTTTVTTVYTTVTAQASITTQTFGPAGDPQLYVARMMTPILGILRRPEYGDPKKRPALREEIRHLLTQASDFGAIRSLVLSTYANDLTPEQRTVFSNRFALLYYSGFILHLEAHANDKFTVTGAMRPNPTRARVAAKTENPKEEVPLSFRLLARPDGWCLYDVHVSNVSLVRTFRKQMREILHDRRFDGLIERIDLAIASDPIASYARKSLTAARDTEEGGAKGTRSAVSMPLPDGETLLRRDVTSDMQITTMALSSVVTTLTTRGVATTMSLCTLYTSQTQRVCVVMVTEQILATATQAVLPSDPGGVVQTTVEQVLQVLRRENYAEHRIQFRHEIRDKILKAVAMDLVGRLTLSHYQKKFTDKEFAEFLEAFANLLLSNYIVHLEKYTDEKFVIDEVKEVSDARVRVETRTVSQSKEIPIDFSMANIDGRWYIYDLRIEGVSLVSNFRQQFRGILLRNPPETLIERIREKVKENESQP